MKWLGDKLKKLLAERGLTQAAFSEMVGVSRQTYSEWVKGQVPKGSHLLKLSKVLEIEPDLLFQDDTVLPVPVRDRDSTRRSPRRQSSFRVSEAPAVYGEPGGEIVLYRAPDGTVSLEVRLQRETIWLTQAQMVSLFGRDQSVIARHVRNVFDEGELDVSNSNMQKMHIAGSDRPVAFYSLDVVISVGYRVNSPRGTQFRIWATRVLRDHILKGYTANASRLKDLKQAVRLVADMAKRRVLTGDEAAALLRVVGDYSRALDLLDDYDHQRVSLSGTTPGEVEPLTYEDAIRAVVGLRNKFGGSDLFGKEKDASLRGALAAVVQTFGGKDLYPSLEEKAAHLLYFLVKSHPFVDGNKRIAAALFVWFLEKNGALYAADGRKRIGDNALVAMTLLIAESKPAEKDLLARVVVNLINRQNS